MFILGSHTGIQNLIRMWNNLFLNLSRNGALGLGGLGGSPREDDSRSVQAVMIDI